jgi:uncharacterized protein
LTLVFICVINSFETKKENIMLVEFKVGNFLSFKDIVTFSMVASADKEYIDTNVIEVDKKLNLLKSCVIYGANASGKSNLFKAMRFMRYFVLSSSRESLSADEIDVEKFRLSTETENEPSTFEIIFMVEGIRYRYGFQVDNERVHNEWLFYVPTIREATLFIREQGHTKIGSNFKEGKGLEDKTRDNALFLSVVDQFNGEIAHKLIEWFKDFTIFSALEDYGRTAFSISKLDDEKFKDFTVRLLKIADTGIKDLQIKSSPIDVDKFLNDIPDELVQNFKKKFSLKLKGSKEIELISVHQKYDKNKNPVSEEHFLFPSNESAGTIALFSFSEPLYFTLLENKVLVIDELSSKLHPLLTEVLIKIFHEYNSCQDENQKSNAQLIFASHDTNMLTNQLFRRDQIWFTQKDEYGVTDLYSLDEYRVRKDASFNKDYTMGKYGAIPLIRNTNSLF